MRELNLAFDSVVAGTMRTWNDISRHFGVPIDILQTLNWEVVEPVDSGQTLVIPRIVEPLSPTMVIEWSIEWSNVDDHRVHAWDTSLPADYQSDRPETDTPLPANYMIVTEDDLLRWMWEHYFSRNPEQYDAQEAQRLFQAQLVDEIIHRARPSQTTTEGWSWMFVNEGTETDQLIEQLIDTPNRETFLGELTPEQLWAIYNQLPRNSVQNRDPAWDYFVSLYQNVQVTAQGGALDNDLWDPSGVFQEDLALQDFFQQQMGTTDPAEIERYLFEVAVGLLISGVADRTHLGLNAEASEDDIRAALRAQLGEHATIDDLMALIYQWASQSQLAEEAEGLAWAQLPPDQWLGTEYDAEALELATRYYDALALDNLRRIAYDRTQVEDARLLIDLRAQVDAMPLVVLGVDISFVHDTLQTYLEAMEAYQRWREQLKDNIEEIDRLMLERQGQEQEPLWWLLEIPLSILVEPLDWLFTIRDLFQGDWTALVGLLPLVPSAIRNITDAARFLPNVPQGFQDILARFDDFLRRFGNDDLTRAAPHEVNVRRTNADVEDYYGRLSSIPGYERFARPQTISQRLGLDHELFPGTSLTEAQMRQLGWFDMTEEQWIEDIRINRYAQLDGNGRYFPVEFSGIFVRDAQGTLRLRITYQGLTTLRGADVPPGLDSAFGPDHFKTELTDQIYSFLHVHLFGSGLSDPDILAILKAPPGMINFGAFSIPFPRNPRTRAGRVDLWEVRQRITGLRFSGEVALDLNARNIADLYRDVLMALGDGNFESPEFQELLEAYLGFTEYYDLY